jgi:hypothetical protein
MQDLKIFKYRGEWQFQQRASFNSLQEVHLSQGHLHVCMPVNTRFKCYTLR